MFINAEKAYLRVRGWGSIGFVNYSLYPPAYVHYFMKHA